MADQEEKTNIPGARIYCARGHNKWGLGFSIHQALDACLPHGGDVLSVVMLPAHARLPRVDQLGVLSWVGPIEHATKKGMFKVIASDDPYENDFDYEPVNRDD